MLGTIRRGIETIRWLWRRRTYRVKKETRDAVIGQCCYQIGEWSWRRLLAADDPLRHQIVLCEERIQEIRDRMTEVESARPHMDKWLYRREMQALQREMAPWVTRRYRLLQGLGAEPRARELAARLVPELVERIEVNEAMREDYRRRVQEARQHIRPGSLVVLCLIVLLLVMLGAAMVF